MNKFLLILFLNFILINIHANSYEDYFNKALEYHEKGDLNNAIEYYSKAISLKSDLYEAYSNRGLVYNDLGMYDKAIDDYNIALDNGVESAVLYNNRGLAYFNKGMYEEALFDYKNALRLDENYADCYNNIGVLYAIQGIMDEAMNNFNIVLKIDPNNANAYNNIGLIYFGEEKYQKAVNNFTNAIVFNPGNFIFFKNRGDSYFLLEKYEEAYNDYETIQKTGSANLYIYFKHLIVSYKLSKAKFNKSYKNLKTNKNNFKNNQWQYLIASFITDELKLEDFLSKCENDKEKLCEAYCYIGYKYLFEKKYVEAKEYFLKCIDTGITNYIEYSLSKKELKKL